LQNHPAIIDRADVRWGDLRGIDVAGRPSS